MKTLYWLPFTSLLIFFGCDATPNPVMPSHLRNSPTAAEDSEEARRQAALQTAKRDLTCSQVSLVMKFDRRYANTTAIRYAIEGCGKRGLYAESCEEYPACRYLLVSIVPVTTSSPP